MSTKSNTNQSTSWVTLVVVIGIGIWLLKSCSDQGKERDVGLKGLGMLEAKGFSGELPPNAGKDYYNMREDSSYKSEDYQYFFAKIRAYQNSRTELRRRGLSDSDLSEIPERELYEAMRSSDPKKALDELAKQYD